MNSTRTIHEELRTIVSAITLHNPHQFTFAGRRFSAAYVKLEDLLYHHCYARRFNGALQESPPVYPAQEQDANWINQLSLHNSSQDRYDEGWTVQQVLPNGYTFVQKDAMSRGVWAGEFVVKDGLAGPLRPGAKVSVRLPRESRTAQPGFYFVFGETPVDSYDEGQVVRFYWNITAQGGPVLVRQLSRQLNKYRLPFRFKLPSHPAFYQRTDAGTLYIPRHYWQSTAVVIEDVYGPIRPYLNSDTPLFTKTIAPGLGFAEDPGTSESFGTVRCRVLAAGLWLAHRAGAHGEDQRLEAVAGSFEQAGISLERPWLKAGSRAEYEFAWES